MGEMKESTLYARTNYSSSKLLSVTDFNSTSSPAVEYLVPWPVKHLVMTFYLTTFLFGILGNTLVMTIICRFPKIRSRSVTAYYIWNLSMADELFLLTLPFFCYNTFTRDWIFGDAACRLVYAFRECNKFASLLTFTAIGVDRLLASYHDLGRYRQIRVGVAACVAIWVVSLAGSAPYLVYGRAVASRGDSTRSACRLNWPSNGVREVWIYLQLTFGFLLPLIAVSVLNALLVRRLSALNRLKRSSSSVARMVLAAFAIFVVCHVPYHVVEVISLEVAKSGQRPDVGKTTVFIYFNVFVQMLVFTSSCSNPVIFGIYNRNYSKCLVGPTQLNEQCCMKR